ncbi:MAG: DUF5703 family protein [Bifidobacteriaceae bacterium]|jgi:hypothetical protein|nr:DUF5703 family protein [Bifidobacteriaceae bacterium]
MIDSWLARGGSYEYRVVTVPAQTPPGASRKLITDQAEYGRWEMARSARYRGGAKRVWLRRKTLKVESTLWWKAYG